MTYPRRQRGRGQALTEFALVIPIAILVLLAIFDVGRAVFIANGLTNAAREGARFAIVHQDAGLIATRVQDMAFLGNVSNAGAPNFVGYFRQNADGTVSNIACSPVTVGCIAVVSAKTTWTAITPIIGDLIGPIELEGRSELPVEFVCPNSAVSAFNTTAKCPKQP
jgi:Flp pilus assembly protein TadG